MATNDTPLLNDVKAGRKTIAVVGKFRHDHRGQETYVFEDEAPIEDEKLTVAALFTRLAPEAAATPGRGRKIGIYKYYKTRLKCPAEEDGNGDRVRVLPDSPFFDSNLPAENVTTSQSSFRQRGLRYSDHF